MILDYLSVQHSYKTFFVESVCEDPKIIEANIKVSSTFYTPAIRSGIARINQSAVL